LLANQTMHLAYRTPLNDDWSRVATTIQRAFDASVACDWTAEARATFFAEASPENLRKAFTEAFFGEVAMAGDVCVGAILLPTPRLLALLFVDPEFQRRHIASTLFSHAAAAVIAADPPVSTISLNSTRAAIPFYESRGFFRISPEFTRSGALAQRMALWLPWYRELHGPRAEAGLAFGRTR
jgi:GNAT superfamily N-acetyltransferase